MILGKRGIGLFRFGSGADERAAWIKRARRCAALCQAAKYIAVAMWA